MYPARANHGIVRVLVTGGTGFIGSHATAALQQAGHEVRLLARTPEKVQRVLAPLGVRASDVVTGDITDRRSVEQAMDGCGAVVHAAAVVAVDRRRAEEVLATNEAGTRNVLEAAHAAGADPIVHLSSVSALFVPGLSIIDADTPVARADSAYGQSKAASDLVARALQDQGAPVTAVYPGGVIGPHDPNLGPTSRAVVFWLTAPVPLTEGGMEIVDVRDVAAALVAAMEPGKGPRRLVLGGRMMSMAEIADVVEEVSGARVRRFRIPAGVLRGWGRLNDLLMRVVPATFTITYEGMEYLTKAVPSDDAPTLEALGLTLRPVRETFEDTIRWLVDEGHVDRAKAPAIA